MQLHPTMSGASRSALFLQLKAMNLSCGRGCALCRSECAGFHWEVKRKETFKSAVPLTLIESPLLAASPKEAIDVYVSLTKCGFRGWFPRGVLPSGRVTCACHGHRANSVLEPAQNRPPAGPAAARVPAGALKEPVSMGSCIQSALPFLPHRLAKASWVSFNLREASK